MSDLEIPDFDSPEHCIYQEFGCPEIFDLYSDDEWQEQDRHQFGCTYRPFYCPVIDCQAKLRTGDDVIIHVYEHHWEQFDTHYGPNLSETFNDVNNWSNGTWTIKKIAYQGKHFFLLGIMKDGVRYHFVRILGNQQEATQFLYKLVLFKGHTKYSFEGQVTSLQFTAEEATKEFKSVFFKNQIVQNLTDESSKIQYQLQLFYKGNLE